MRQSRKLWGLTSPFMRFAHCFYSGGYSRNYVEELASVYIKEMRSFFPQGPYLIGGGSFGGIVAFEMAQQLYAQGAEPALLVLFDTSAPGSVQRVGTTEKLRGFWQRVQDQGSLILCEKSH